MTTYMHRGLERTLSTPTAKFSNGGYNETFCLGGKKVVAFHTYKGCFKSTVFCSHINGAIRKFYCLNSLAGAIHGERAQNN